MSDNSSRSVISNEIMNKKFFEKPEILQYIDTRRHCNQV